MSATHDAPTGASTDHGALDRVIQGLDMSEHRKEWMRARWLAQVRWFDRRAEAANRKHSILRVVAITGGVLVPGLVSVGSGVGSDDLSAWAQPLAFVVSLMVAAAVGLDSFYHFGERWRHYRKTAEMLKTEGWLFIEGAGRYRKEQHRRNFHDVFFPVFATKVEEIIQHDVEVYLTQIVQEKREDHDEEEQEMQRVGETDRSRSTQDEEAAPSSESAAAPPEPE
ncbi:MAG: DUF4231 domain-containing protein [Actinomycetota bacterium]